MIKKILCILFVITITFSSFVSAEELNIMTHYKGILCEQDFNSYEGGVPNGFIQQLSPYESTIATITKTIGKDGTPAVNLSNQFGEHKLAYKFDIHNMKAIEVNFDFIVHDFNAEKTLYIENSINGKIDLMSICTDGSLNIGNTKFTIRDFEIIQNEWYNVKITYNLLNGFVKIEVVGCGCDKTLYGDCDVNVNNILETGFISANPYENRETEFSIDNLIIKGADPIYPTDNDVNDNTETFDDVENFLDTSWTVQYHNSDNGKTPTYGIFKCPGKNGNGAALVSDGKMIELIKTQSVNSSYYMSVSVYFNDMQTKRTIAAKGYPYNSTSLTGEVELISFNKDGTARVGASGGPQFDYEIGKWYDIDMYINNVDGSLKVIVNDGTAISHYAGTMSTVIQRLFRTYLFNSNYQGSARSEWRIDNFRIFTEKEFHYSTFDSEEGVRADIGEINLEFFGNITEIGPILLNGTVNDIIETQVQGNIVSVKINQLENEKEYTLSFAGVKDGTMSYKNGYVRFKTSPETYISTLNYKNERGSLDSPDAEGFSTYFKGHAQNNTDIVIYSALYSADGKELLEINSKNAVLEEYEKEYEIYMELPKNNENYIYRILVWSDELKPLNIKFPMCFERPSGLKVLSDVEAVTGQNVHPRLFINRNKLDEVKSRVMREGLMKDSYDALLKSADELITQKPKEYELSDGIRLLNVSREIRNRVQTLGVAYALSGDEKYAERLYAELDNASSFVDWNPNHFLDTAEMLAAFAIGYDLIYDYISMDTNKKDKIVNAVRYKGYEPLLDDYLDRPRKRTYKWTLANNPDNWNVVCNGGGIMAAVSFADELPEYSRQIFEYAFPLLEKAANQFGPDGAWFEGMDYWLYTIKYYTDILCALNTAAGDDYGFSNVDGLRETGYFQFAMNGEGGTFNFSECAPGTIYATEVFYLANLFGDKKLETLQYNFTNKLNRNLGARGLLWYDGSYDTQIDKIHLDYYFRDTEVCSMRSSYDTDANYIGFCAGKNNVAHAQLDVGSFVLDMEGKRFACDLGVEDYNIKTTYEWEPYRNRAEGHNTLVINPDINPDQNDEARTVINRFETSEESAIAVCDMTAAYSDDVKSAIRGIRFLNNRSTVLLQDEIRCIEPSDIWWFMHTQANITVSDDGKVATLKRDGVTINAKILTSDGAFRVMDAKPLDTSPQNSSQNPNSSYKKLAIYFEDVTNLDIAVEFSPEHFAGSSASVLPIISWQ